jgi:putative protein-disulfide isomerase
MTATLYYVHDPMCSWCYAFTNCYQHIKDNLPDNIVLNRLLGGLARDTEEDMPDAMREHIQSNWKKIEQTVPGVTFNFDFWKKCRPRRATYLACRAVIAARQQGVEYDEIMTRAIQQGYYLDARNPSNLDTLVKIGEEVGLKSRDLSADIQSDETYAQLKKEIHLSRELGISSFPSLLLIIKGQRILLPHHYSDPQAIMVAIRSAMQLNG